MDLSEKPRLGVAAEMRPVSRARTLQPAAFGNSATSRTTGVAALKFRSAGGVEIQPCEAEHGLAERLRLTGAQFSLDLPSYMLLTMIAFVDLIFHR
ncbi:MAG: hypothetical protein CL912_04760 [Deltaproteobacteria bacterium]|nr:hypothetical protein [Deltaproteobacteria bacterium]